MSVLGRIGTPSNEIPNNPAKGLSRRSAAARTRGVDPLIAGAQARLNRNEELTPGEFTALENHFQDAITRLVSQAKPGYILSHTWAGLHSLRFQLLNINLKHAELAIRDPKKPLSDSDVCRFVLCHDLFLKYITEIEIAKKPEPRQWDNFLSAYKRCATLFSVAKEKKPEAFPRHGKSSEANVDYISNKLNPEFSALQNRYAHILRDDDLLPPAQRQELHESGRPLLPEVEPKHSLSNLWSKAVADDSGHAIGRLRTSMIALVRGTTYLLQNTTPWSEIPTKRDTQAVWMLEEELTALEDTLKEFRRELHEADTAPEGNLSSEEQAFISNFRKRSDAKNARLIDSITPLKDSNIGKWNSRALKNKLIYTVFNLALSFLPNYTTFAQKLTSIYRSTDISSYSWAAVKEFQLFNSNISSSRYNIDDLLQLHVLYMAVSVFFLVPLADKKEEALADALWYGWAAFGGQMAVSLPLQFRSQAWDTMRLPSESAIRKGLAKAESARIAAASPKVSDTVAVQKDGEPALAESGEKSAAILEGDDPVAASKKADEVAGPKDMDQLAIQKSIEETVKKIATHLQNIGFLEEKTGTDNVATGSVLQAHLDYLKTDANGLLKTLEAAIRPEYDRDLRTFVEARKELLEKAIRPGMAMPEFRSILDASVARADYLKDDVELSDVVGLTTRMSELFSKDRKAHNSGYALWRATVNIMKGITEALRKDPALAFRTAIFLGVGGVFAINVLSAIGLASALPDFLSDAAYSLAILFVVGVLNSQQSVRGMFGVVKNVALLTAIGIPFVFANRFTHYADEAKGWASVAAALVAISVFGTPHLEKFLNWLLEKQESTVAIEEIVEEELAQTTDLAKPTTGTEEGKSKALTETDVADFAQTGIKLQELKPAPESAVAPPGEAKAPETSEPRGASLVRAQAAALRQFPASWAPKTNAREILKTLQGADYAADAGQQDKMRAQIASALKSGKLAFGDSTVESILKRLPPPAPGKLFTGKESDIPAEQHGKLLWLENTRWLAEQGSIFKSGAVLKEGDLTEPDIRSIRSALREALNNGWIELGNDGAIELLKAVYPKLPWNLTGRRAEETDGNKRLEMLVERMADHLRHSVLLDPAYRQPDLDDPKSPSEPETRGRSPAEPSQRKSSEQPDNHSFLGVDDAAIRGRASTDRRQSFSARPPSHASATERSFRFGDLHGPGTAAGRFGAVPSLDARNPFRTVVKAGIAPEGEMSSDQLPAEYKDHMRRTLEAAISVGAIAENDPRAIDIRRVLTDTEPDLLKTSSKTTAPPSSGLMTDMSNFQVAIPEGADPKDIAAQDPVDFAKSHPDIWRSFSKEERAEIITRADRVRSGQLQPLSKTDWLELGHLRHGMLALEARYPQVSGRIRLVSPLDAHAITHNPAEDFLPRAYADPDATEQKADFFVLPVNDHNPLVPSAGSTHHAFVVVDFRGEGKPRAYYHDSIDGEGDSDMRAPYNFAAASRLADSRGWDLAIGPTAKQENGYVCGDATLGGIESYMKSLAEAGDIPAGGLDLSTLESGRQHTLRLLEEAQSM